MINYKIIFRALGSLLYIESLLLAICMGVGAVYQETDFWSFGLPSLISALMGGALTSLSRGAKNRLGRREGYLVVSLTWVVFSLIGSVPFMLEGCTDRFAVAFFESMSGFSTTGSSAFSDIDALPHSILFWRSISHWLGGMGIVFFTLAILPGMSNGDQKLFSAEATGLKMGKLHPRIGTTARWLWGFYLALTGVCFLALHLAGMNIFDAVNHAMSTVSTGGFSTHTASIGYFDSPAIELTEVVFMFCSSINFSLLYLIIFKGKYHIFWKDSELRGFVIILLASIALVTPLLIPSDVLSLSFEQCSLTDRLTMIGEGFRRSIFNCVSLMSTTGLTTEDFMKWHPMGWLILTVISVSGACAGSTSGGIKLIRLITAGKVMLAEFFHAMHPRAVNPIRINGSIVPQHVINSVFGFFAAYVAIIVISISIISHYGYSMADSMGMAISSFSNIGPTVGHALGPLDSWGDLPDTVLHINSFLMLCGRLEVFSLLLPFIPSFWRED